MYGFGSESKKLNELIQKYGLENHVYLRGFLSNLDQEYSDAYLSLITSKMEGFGLAILESLSVGTPVISYDVDYGPSELIQDGFNGYLVPQGDINQMVEKVDQLLNNTQKLQQFSINSIESAQQYNATTISTKWQNILN